MLPIIRYFCIFSLVCWLKNVHNFSQKLMSIFDYYNYRKYLQDYYKQHKVLQRYFSYRSFAQKAGYSSSGYYLDLVQGRRSLTPQMLSKFIVGLGLNEKEARFFRLMVDFTHAETIEAKQQIFERMSLLLPKSAKILTKNQQGYYAQWYHVAVREALSILNINETNVQELAGFLNPKISVPQAKQTLRLLQDLELIRKENGFFRSVDKAVSSGKDISALFVHQFQKQMIDLGKEALDRYSIDRRNVSTTTMSVSAEGMIRVHQKIEAFQKEILDIVQSDEGETMVCELNVQFFPMSEERKVSHKEIK